MDNVGEAADAVKGFPSPGDTDTVRIAPALPKYASLAPSLLGAGYEPIPIRPGTKRPAPRRNWQKPIPGDFQAWQRSYPDCGIGLLTRWTPACDIDFLDQAIGDEIEALARQMLGDSTLLRFGKAPKRLLVFKTAAPFAKLKSNVLLAPDDPADGKGHAVEILCDGQQFVAFGIHSDTGKPYCWPGSSPQDTPAAELLNITAEQAAEFIDAVNALLESKLIPAGWRYREPPKTKATGRIGATGNDPYALLNAAALQHLDEWVPGLVPGAVRHGSGYRCVATWRNCTNANVGIHSSGVMDFGADLGHSPIGLIKLANDWSFTQSAQALADQLGVDLPAVAISPAPDPNAPSADEVRAQVRDAIKSFVEEAVEYHRDPDQFHIVTGTAEQVAAGERGVIHIPGVAPGCDLTREYSPDGGKAPLVRAIVCATGIGKSELVRRLVVPELREALPDQPVVVLAPTLDLCEEAAQKARDLGLKATVIRGRNANQPGGSEEKMCLDLEAAIDAWQAGDDVQSSVCRKKERGKPEALCPYFDECPYQRQRAEAVGTDVLYMAHDHLFRPKPTFIATPSALIIDESFLQNGVSAQLVVACDQLSRSRDIRDSDGNLDHAASHRLLELNQELAKIIAGCDGPLTVSALLDAEMWPYKAAEAYRLWWRVEQQSGIRPGMTAEARKKCRELVEANNRQVHLYTGLWKVVRDFLDDMESSTAWVRCGMVHTADGDTPGCTVRYRKEIRTGWDVPVLLLDATLRRELVAPFYPWNNITETPYPATPFAEVVQIRGAPVTKRKLSEAEGRRGRDRTTARNHLTDLARYIEVRAARFRKVLVVAQMEVEESLKSIGLPGNVEIAHFNNTRGIDRWGDVDYLLVIGRTLPAPAGVEVPAEALTGRPVNPLPPEPPLNWAWYPTREGGSEYHPDPDAEAVRWGICEAEILQTIGRARAVNRTADNPVLIEVLCDVSLPVPVNRTERWSAPTRVAVMVARGVVLENMRDRARCFPDLWGTEQAAKNDNLRTVANAYIDISIEQFATVLVNYQLGGAGQKPRRARFNPAMIPDPRSWLEARLGQLARYEVVPTETAAASSNPLRQILEP